ncbi:MAG: PLP-dependent aminotransferase family protein [Tepidisphaeraceae bacterium]|jgi:2-aminoadipate transaminase
MSQQPPILLSAKARRTHESPISTLIATVIANPNLISFAAGLVDPVTLPVDECLAITRKIFSDPKRAQATLQYDTTIGLTALRQEVLAHICRLEGKTPEQLGLNPDDLLITTGSQQMLYLVADALVDPGDIVICGNPTYFVFAGALETLGASVMTVPMDQDGMDVEALDRLLGRIEAAGQLRRVKLVYCTSFFDNPTGLTLSLPRRRRMLDIVRGHSRSHRILILEDAAYRELNYDGASPPSIKSFDPDNQFVVLTHTFSKPFAPGIKLGYTVLPREVHEAVLHQKGSHDFGSANISQQIALEALRDGSYARHVQRLHREYRKKRDAMLAALEKHMPRVPGLSWTRPGGGLYVWVTLPQGIRTSREGRLFEDCLERGVIYVPGEYCMQKGCSADSVPTDNCHPERTREGSGLEVQSRILREHALNAGRGGSTELQPLQALSHVPTNHLRLSFGQVDIAQIDDGIARLAAAVADQLAANSSPSADAVGATS